jgi:hydrogenase maturation protease
MLRELPKILVYGYGNPGRQDDGLGISIAERIELWVKDNQIANVKTDSNYQLNIEDAVNISENEIVFFVDASKEELKNFTVTKLEPSDKANFTMHAVSPEYVLNICKEMYDKIPETYLVHIKGYEWNFLEEMTHEAKENLEDSFRFLVKCISNINMNH